MLRSKANHKSSHQDVNSGSSNINGSPTKSRRTNSNVSSLSSVNLTTKTNNNNSIHRFVIFVILVTVTIMIAFPQLVRHEDSDAHFRRGSQQHQLKLRHDYSYKYNNNNNDHNIDHNIISNKTNDSIPRGRFKFGISLEDAKAIKIRNAQLEKDKILENEKLRKNIIAARVGEMETFSKEELEKRRNTTNISLVISHCESGVKWILEYLGDEYKKAVKDITIISKCNKKVIGLVDVAAIAPTKVITLPNLGRCDHSYAYYIQEHFREVEKSISIATDHHHNDDDNDDIVFFIKDNDRLRRSYYDIDKLFTTTSKAGFSCIVKPECDCSMKCKRSKYKPMMMHNRTYLFDFSLEKYEREKRDTNDHFLSEQYPDMNTWVQSMEFNIPNTTTVPVCYLGMFATKKKHFLNQPEEVWQRMTKSLERENNLIEGHYAERVWASILSNVDYDHAQAVDGAILPHIQEMVKRPSNHDEVCGMASMFYVKSRGVKFEY